MLEVVLTDKATTEGLSRIYDRVRNPVGMLKVIGRRGSNELKDHFRRRNTTPNKMGGRRTNFWNEIAGSVKGPLIESTSRVRVSVTDRRFVQKVFGGRIMPNKAKALTIPAEGAPETHGLTVQEFQVRTGIQLFLLRKKGGGLTNLLAGALGGGVRSSRKFKVYYVLVPYVDQEADPEALPPREQFNAAILDESDQYLSRAIKSGGTQ